MGLATHKEKDKPLLIFLHAEGGEAGGAACQIKRLKAESEVEKSIMREYDDRRAIENFYEKAKKRIKEQIALKGIDMKGGAKGQALTEIMDVLDKELEINIAEEMLTARKMLREYYKKYNEVESLDRKIYENQEKLAEQQAVCNMVSLLTDDVLKNAILAYQAIRNERAGRYGNSEDAKAIAIAYITAKGREDLKEVIADEVQ